MKISLSLLLLSVGIAAQAQNPAIFRNRDRDWDQRNFVGRYEAFQRDDSVRRTLVLDRDGRVELVTEVRRGRGRIDWNRNDRNDRDRRDDRRWDDDDTKSYGTLAKAAFEDNRAVRHTGRWREDDGRIELTLTDRNDTRGRENQVFMRLTRRNNELVFDSDQKVYGRAKINFRRDGGWDGGRPGNFPSRPRYGYVRYDRDEWGIDGIDLVDRGRDSRLVIRTPNRRIELRGEARRRGDEVNFKLDFDGRDGGEYVLRMRGNEVDSIRGEGTQDRHRIGFREERSRY